MDKQEVKRQERRESEKDVKGWRNDVGRRVEGMRRRRKYNEV